jgi:hypothetical protein
MRACKKSDSHDFEKLASAESAAGHFNNGLIP